MNFLVIDDDICIYALLKKQIKKYWDDALIEHYNPVKQGIPHCEFKWSDYDIILLDYDIGVSGFTGLDILSRLNQIDNYPVVIMITGEGNENTAVKAIQTGADDYLIKYDIITERLYDVINEARQLREKTRINFAIKSTTNNNNRNKKKNNSLIDIKIPGYNILDILSNNISVILYATRDVDKKPVAIKLQKIIGDKKSVAIKRFEQELDLLARLDHPNVIKILDHGFSGIYLYYSMEYIQNGDMSRLLSKGPIPPEKASRYFQQILKGINALHNIHIIHRDIKANNILFRDQGNLVVADLGAAKNLFDNNDITLHGEIIGTPYYMSPEQFNGENIDFRSDIYSLGVLFYEMLIGEKPYKGENVMEIVYKQSYESPAKLPDTLAEYQNIINKMLEFDREKRYQTINYIIYDIEKISWA